MATQATDASLSPALTAFSLETKALGHALNHIMQRQVDYADLYFQRRQQESWQLENGIVRPTGFSRDQGIGVRAVSGEKTAFSYTNNISAAALLNAAGTVREITRQGQNASVALPASLPQGITSLYPQDNPLTSITERQKCDLLASIDRQAKARDPRVTRVSAYLGASYETILIARHDGKLATDVRPLVNLTIAVVAEQQGRRETGSSGGGRRLDYRFFDAESVTRWVCKAVDQALNNLEAGPAPAGTYSVVLGAGSPGILLHEAIGHGLEGDFNRKGSSAFSNLLGERVAAKGITVVDDGTMASRRGSLHVDDEGTPTQTTALIEDGILRGYLQDSLNAMLMNAALTGNARRTSYASLPLPRMTNTYMLAGQYPADEIIASVKNGVYAAGFSGGQVDISSGKYVFATTEAYLIENGKITRPVKGATLIGHGPEALLHVSMVGNNLALDEGNISCSKEGQTLPVSVGQPTLRIDNMTVGGSQ
ncbi:MULTISPECIES: metalloprotease TldD [Brenneria]|uniref:Metalloprotease TldD n=1 Tax=Brenneria nigrifluens DSM 30175 = ATCC 13028 TaxID=1121120 RepID=A0A2U1UWY4_9GAMM|nr:MULTISPECIES: metalloprotease TldD [Brenneria]EHD22544.1 peptidase U62 modulator of DNA gyrase [Brenneria sp. EniD312]PWC26081.1 metalloprotease TldD [Brenneria nigrifluens] [Brenneria nigrifluens DSM 30175 = ATCC 13028]QCR05534.1 metalloprotease TldD [Brenneria nigrifluens] [Brenneria nigrifluens DSM 30175 = ATCC 13028]